MLGWSLSVAVGSSFLIAWFPLVMLGIVILFLVAFFWLTPKIVLSSLSAGSLACAG